MILEFSHVQTHQTHALLQQKGHLNPISLYRGAGQEAHCLLRSGWGRDSLPSNGGDVSSRNCSQRRGHNDLENLRALVSGQTISLSGCEAEVEGPGTRTTSQGSDANMPRRLTPATANSEVSDQISLDLGRVLEMFPRGSGVATSRGRNGRVLSSPAPRERPSGCSVALIGLVSLPRGPFLPAFP